MRIRSAIFVAVPLACVATSASPAPLRDLRVGEAEGVVRVVLVCAAACAAEPDGDLRYRIEGVSDAFDYAPRTNGDGADGEGAGLRRVSLVPDGDGARLTIETDRPPADVAVSACRPDAVCFDLAMLPPTESAPAPAATLRELIAREDGAAPSAADCVWAAGTLSEDGWAVEAYRMLAVCRALAGEGREASAMLARLARHSGEARDAALARLIADAPTALR